MQFQRLRLSGFKSFVDPTELRIEPGLTGVVGPNGCGKSNLLEALRWVMGANSAKAMRADGMDEVIFAGSSARPSRNHAEVSLTLDNAERGGPARFAAEPVLEVVRRIDRGQGSTYRINAAEVRARDVQLLFADASTGANSPALVRQGQISELIAAKPQNRRRILEEAAGVSGLHTRRHEAELRLRAAEANLARLDDLSRELEANLGRLKREARQAERFKTLSAQIRTLQSGVLFSRWAGAREVLLAVEAEGSQAARAVEDTAREAAQAGAAALTAETALPPLREEAQIAGAVLHRIAIEKDRLEGEASRVQAEIARLDTELSRLEEAREREAHIVADAAAALERLETEVAAEQAKADAAPSRLPQLQAAWEDAESLRKAADEALERLAGEVAADEARRRAAAARIQEARERLARTTRALDLARADREAVGPSDDPAMAETQAKLNNAQAAQTAARQALEDAESQRARAQTTEQSTRTALREAEDRLGRLKAEARGLAQVTAQPKPGGYPPALDAVRPHAGLEIALAAALGDDLDAALDGRAPAHWAGADAKAPAWPAGVEPLGPLVDAPKELAARLAYVGLVDRKDGERLAKGLAPGARIVSREGDLWRWDGFAARAEAPKPAAVRLEQKNRLVGIEAEIDRLSPAQAEAALAHADAARALTGAEAVVREARTAAQDAERSLGPARDAVERQAREAARRDARAQSLDETIGRFDAERVAAQEVLATAVAEGEDPTGGADLSPMLDEARTAASAARETAAARRADLDQETRERQARAHRLESAKRDRADWTRRSEAAAKRIATLADEKAKALSSVTAARQAPAALAQRTEKLLNELSVAQARQTKAADALATAESTRAEADRFLRTAEAKASEARERRAGLLARLDAARQRLAETAAAVRETARMEPEALGETLSAEKLGDPQTVEARLYQLERDREAIGPVNLRAEADAQELAVRLTGAKTDKDDLTTAIQRLREGVEALNAEGRERLLAAFDVIDGHFRSLFSTLFDGGQAELRLVESDDPLEAGLEIYACPPGKRLSTMSLMSGGEQALTAAALIFAVFLANPAPVCVLDEVDAPLDDANVDRFCNLLDEMRKRTQTRFIVITHNAVTMSRMDRLYGVTMPERGISQLVSVDLRQAEAMVTA